MNRSVFVLALTALLTLVAGAHAQQSGEVASAEIPGVEATRSHSQNVQAWRLDDSLGEVRVVVRALDADGDPVAGAPVQWRVANLGDTLVYVVGASTDLPDVPLSAYTVRELTIDGGTTDDAGEAFLVLDAMSAGDARVFVDVGGVEAKTYDGRDMRVVWF